MYVAGRVKTGWVEWKRKKGVLVEGDGYTKNS